MRILLVWPNLETHGSKPNSLSLLSGLMKRDGHDVRLFDTTFMDLGFVDTYEAANRANIFKPVDYAPYNMQKIPCDLKNELYHVLNDFNPHIIGVSALSDEVSTGLEISRLTKEWRNDICVIWGNRGVTSAPERILSSGYVDYACIGEGIELLPEFVRCIQGGLDPRQLQNLAFPLENGLIARNPLRPFSQNLDSLAYFDYSIFDERQFIKPFDGKIYRGGDHMITWGCPNSCSYCYNKSYRSLYSPSGGQFIRSYSVDRIIKELKTLILKWDLQFFKFYDEDFCLKPMEYFRHLAEKYRNEINLPFTIMANAKSISSEKVELLSRMGCASVSMGFESGNEWIRRNVLNRNETMEAIIEATKLFNEAGIRTSAFNMLGLPFETREAIFDTIELNRASEVAYPDVSFFFPYEGTEIFQVCVDNGFWIPDSAAAYRSDKPALSNLPISSGELVGIRDRFVFYVKLPKEYWPYIRRSEEPDPLGAKLTSELCQIYQRTIFANNGIMPTNYNMQKDINFLEDLARSRKPN